MGERYYISGVQLGQMKFDERDRVIEEVIDKQFIGNFPTDKDKEMFNKELKRFIAKVEKKVK